MPEEPPVDPPEPFFWTKPAEPDPRTLRPIPTLIGDTFRFIAHRWRALLGRTAPAVVAVVLSWQANLWGYEQIYDDVRGNTSALGLALGTLVVVSVFALGTYFFSTALAYLVVQSARNEPTRVAAAARMAVRRLPRVMTVNLLYGLLVLAVFLPIEFLLLRTLVERELGYLWPWLYLSAGIVAYGAPQINVYFTAIKMEDRQPRFRRARQLVRGQRAAVLGRVLLCQIVRVASLAIWALVSPEAWSLGALLLSLVSFVIATTILTTSFTLLYVDLAGVSADDRVPEDETALNAGSEAGDGGQAQRPT